MRILLRTLILTLTLMGSALAAEITVDSSGGGAGDCSIGGSCTLGAALSLANTTSERDTISFDSSLSPSCTISLTAILPTVVYPVTIEGLNAEGCSKVAIEDGSSISTGLDFGSGSQSSTISNLAISGFDTNVSIDNVDSASYSEADVFTFKDSYIGVGLNGNSPVSGSGTGIYIENSEYVKISNVVSYSENQYNLNLNDSDYVDIDGCKFGSTEDFQTVSTHSTLTIVNGNDNLTIQNSYFNTNSTATDSWYILVADNVKTGVEERFYNTLLNNKFGFDSANNLIGSADKAVYVTSPSTKFDGNYIGSALANSTLHYVHRNLAPENLKWHTISNNNYGLKPNGSDASSSHGVALHVDGEGHTISGNNITGASDKNLNLIADSTTVSGNKFYNGNSAYYMIYLDGTGNTINGGNYIGMNSSSVVSGSHDAGIYVANGSHTISGNYIGGADTGNLNIQSDSNTVSGNYIYNGNDTNIMLYVAGNSNTINGGNYIGMNSSGEVSGTHQTTVSLNGNSNTFSSNYVAGASAGNEDLSMSSGTGNSVTSNTFCTNSSGTEALTAGSGVRLSGSITATFSNNTIDGCGEKGVVLGYGDKSNITIEDNNIGQNISGSLDYGYYLSSGITNSTISGGSVSNASVAGVYFGSEYAMSPSDMPSENLLSGVTITNNAKGISVEEFFDEFRGTFNPVNIGFSRVLSYDNTSSQIEFTGSSVNSSIAAPTIDLAEVNTTDGTLTVNAQGIVSDGVSSTCKFEVYVSDSEGHLEHQLASSSVYEVAGTIAGTDCFIGADDDSDVEFDLGSVTEYSYVSVLFHQFDSSMNRESSVAASQATTSSYLTPVIDTFTATPLKNLVLNPELVSNEVIFTVPNDNADPLTKATSFEWDFGDGTTITEANSDPNSEYTYAHTYTSEGVYTVTLTAVNPAGSTLSATSYQIVVYPKPNAAFDYTQSGRTFVFTNKSSGSGVLSFEWDFGDGNSSNSTDDEVTHTYSSDVKRTVRLDVENELGSSYSDFATREVTPVSTGGGSRGSSSSTNGAASSSSSQGGSSTSPDAAEAAKEVSDTPDQAEATNEDTQNQLESNEEETEADTDTEEEIKLTDETVESESEPISDENTEEVTQELIEEPVANLPVKTVEPVGQLDVQIIKVVDNPVVDETSESETGETDESNEEGSMLANLEDSNTQDKEVPDALDVSTDEPEKLETDTKKQIAKDLSVADFKAFLANPNAGSQTADPSISAGAVKAAIKKVEQQDVSIADFLKDIEDSKPNSTVSKVLLSAEFDKQKQLDIVSKSSNAGSFVANLGLRKTVKSDGCDPSVKAILNSANCSLESLAILKNPKQANNKVKVVSEAYQTFPSQNFVLNGVVEKELVKPETKVCMFYKNKLEKLGCTLVDQNGSYAYYNNKPLKDNQIVAVYNDEVSDVITINISELSLIESPKLISFAGQEANEENIYYVNEGRELDLVLDVAPLTQVTANFQSVLFSSTAITTASDFRVNLTPQSDADFKAGEVHTVSYFAENFTNPELKSEPQFIRFKVLAKNPINAMSASVASFSVLILVLGVSIYRRRNQKILSSD